MSANLQDAFSVSDTPISMSARQKPLIRMFATEPEKAWVIDRAKTSSEHIPVSRPFHSEVTFGASLSATQCMGAHRKVGGACDFPNPGELLSAALASCLDITIRILANRLALPLKRLAVICDARVDVRGTLRVDKNVPVGFQAIDVWIDIEADDGVTPDQIDMLLVAAEQSCVVLQTLRNTPQITTSRRNTT